MKKKWIGLLVASMIMSQLPLAVWANETIDSTTETTVQTEATSVETEETTEQSSVEEISESSSSLEVSTEETSLEETVESSFVETSESSTIESISESQELPEIAPMAAMVSFSYATVIKEVPLRNDQLIATEKTTKSHLKQTLKVKTVVSDGQGKNYYQLETNKKQLLGYVEEGALKLTNSPGGKYFGDKKYVILTSKNYDIWQNFTWKRRNHSSNYHNQVLEARGYYDHFNGSRYLSLYDSKGTWVGYINQTGTKTTKDPHSGYKSYGKFVTISSKNYDIWQKFSWKKRNHSSSYHGQTLEARGYYDHFNGSRYLSLYDSKGSWVGYINQTGTKLANGRQGSYQAYGESVTIEKNYTIWQNFSWKKKADANKYKGHTLIAKGFYNHLNGSTYLSLYNQKGQWLGYINADAVKIKAKKAGWAYATVQQNNLPVWQNFQWKQRTTTRALLGKTYRINVAYQHYNGKLYYSLFNSKNQWQGYVEASGVTTLQQPQGNSQTIKEYVKVTKKNYNLHANFSWQKKQASDSLVNQVFQARERFQHYNGASYVSLYNELGTWQGYINEGALQSASASQFIDKERLNTVYQTTAVFKQGTATTTNWNQFQAALKEANNKLAKAKKQNEVNQAANTLDTLAKPQFIAFLAGDAQKIAKANDLYPSVMLAQAILESGYGRSELAYQAKNMFGIKFNEGKDEGQYGFYEVASLEFINGQYVSVTSKFRKYPALSESLKDNALKLSKGVSWDANYYKGAWRSQAKTYQEATRALTGKYATDPNYHTKLNKVIEDWALYQYD